MNTAVNSLLSELKSGKYCPVYFLHGEEPYYIDVLSDYIEDHVLDDMQKGFDQTVLYGKDTDMITVVNAARRYPMMASHQVIIIKEAQLLKWKSEEEVLAKYLENPMPNTILVFAYKHAKFDKRKKVYKLADKIGRVLESAKIYDNKLPDWIMGYAHQKSRKIHPQAAALTSEHLGANLSKVVNELDKLMLNVPKDREIGLEDVEKFIGISKDFNVFELNTALAKRDVLGAFRIVDYFAANQRNHPSHLTIAAIANYFIKILQYHYLADKSQQTAARELGVHPFFVSEYQLAARNYNRGKVFQVISCLHEYDLKVKGVGVGDIAPGDLLKELVYKILN